MRVERIIPGTCRSCKYDLSGLDNLELCPECGNDPTIPEFVESKLDVKIHRLCVMSLLVMILITIHAYAKYQMVSVPTNLTGWDEWNRQIESIAWARAINKFAGMLILPTLATLGVVGLCARHVHLWRSSLLFLLMVIAIIVERFAMMNVYF